MSAIAFVVLAASFHVSVSIQSTRYGILSQDVCPNSGDPQKTRDGNIVWCKKDSDCQMDHACTPIEGLTHFGVQINYCCPNRIAVCSEAPQPGYGECGRKPMRMFYFDVTSLRCQPFTVVECKGLNGNRFPSMAECKRRCEATACHRGESPLLMSNQPVLCGESGICPPPYKCRYDTLFRRHVCCGFKREGACPLGYRSYMNILTGRPKRCRRNAARDDCPVDFVCSTPEHSVISFCCSEEKGVCPRGRPPYIHPLTDHTMKCLPSAAILNSDCPFGYACVPSVPGAQWGFCCLEVVGGECPLGSRPQLDASSKHPLKCTPGSNSCSPGYQCQMAPGDSKEGFCCSSKFSASSAVLTTLQSTTVPPPTTFKPSIRLVDIQKRIDKSETKRIQRRRHKPALRSHLRCPDDRESVIPTNTTSPQQCLPAVVSKCPPGSECVRAPKDPLGRYLCCQLKEEEDEDDIFAATLELSTLVQRRTSASKDPFCPVVLTGSKCSPSESKCSEEGFFCQFNIELQSFACCSLTQAP